MNTATNGDGARGGFAWAGATNGGGGLSAFRLVMAVLGLNVPLVLLILLRNVGARDLAPISWVYLCNVAVGYYGLPLLIVVSLLFVILMRAHRAATFASWICIALFVYYLLLDSVVYRIFRFHINPFWLEFAVKDSGSLGVAPATLLAAAAMLPAVAAAELGIFAFARRFVASRRRVYLYPFLVLAAFAVSQALHAVTYERNDPRITALTPCFPAYVPVTAHSRAERFAGGPVPGRDEADDGEGPAGKSSLRYPLAELRFDPGARSRRVNVLFLLLESWRHDAFDERTTPNIWELGRSSAVFLDHLSTGNQTTCGIFGLFYGMQPAYWSAVKANSAAVDNPVLIDAMKARGYAFGIFAKSKFDRHKISATIFNGIDVQEDFAGSTIPAQDADMTRRLVAFMKESARGGTPFLALAFFKSSHAPYEYPPEHRVFEPTKNLGLKLDGDTDPAPFLNDYRNSLHFADALVGEIVDSLRAAGAFENTVIVVTTDHGESFNDGGENFWGHGSNFTRHQIQVPFILRVPGRAPERIERRTSHMDLVPTLMRRVFGCTSDPRAYANGIDLFDGSAAPRPLVIGSYVTQAFVLGEDVHEILPGFTKKYTLDDIHGKASEAPPALVKLALEDINRFAR